MIKEYRREHLTIWGSGVSYWNDMCYKHCKTESYFFKRRREKVLEGCFDEERNSSNCSWFVALCHSENKQQWNRSRLWNRDEAATLNQLCVVNSFMRGGDRPTPFLRANIPGCFR
ncbi:hypothetical protein HDU92_003041 [Lobulomyces angularis]|nr:hypothetical protein HDU92_003041 [Lobulomyces angularis]